MLFRECHKMASRRIFKNKVVNLGCNDPLQRCTLLLWWDFKDQQLTFDSLEEHTRKNI